MRASWERVPTLHLAVTTRRLRDGRLMRGNGLSAPAELPYLTQHKPKKTPREVFLYVISGAKERNPSAAMALLERTSN